MSRVGSGIVSFCFLWESLKSITGPKEEGQGFMWEVLCCLSVSINLRGLICLQLATEGLAPGQQKVQFFHLHSLFVVQLESTFEQTQLNGTLWWPITWADNQTAFTLNVWKKKEKVNWQKKKKMHAWTFRHTVSQTALSFCFVARLEQHLAAGE